MQRQQKQFLEIKKNTESLILRQSGLYNKDYVKDNSKKGQFSKQTQNEDELNYAGDHDIFRVFIICKRNECEMEENVVHEGHQWEIGKIPKMNLNKQLMP